MAFGIGINTNENICPEKKGNRMDIACECWYTKSGRSIPLKIKYEDEDGTVRTIRSIQVLYTEKKNYSGIPSIEHQCILNIYGIELSVSLIFYTEENRWVMVY